MICDLLMRSIWHFMTDYSTQPHGRCVTLQLYQQVDVIVGQMLTAVWFAGKPLDICQSKAMVSCPSVGHGVGSILMRDWAEILHSTAASLGRT